MHTRIYGHAYVYIYIYIYTSISSRSITHWNGTFEIERERYEAFGCVVSIGKVSSTLWGRSMKRRPLLNLHTTQKAQSHQTAKNANRAEYSKHIDSMGQRHSSISSDGTRRNQRRNEN